MPSAASSYARTGTPSIQVSDARGLVIRAVQLYRRDASDPIETRVAVQRFDTVGRLLGSRDPYLFELAKTDPLTPFNLTQVASLSGVALLTDSVDAGWRIALAGGDGQMMERCDGRGSRSVTEYDQLLRPLAVRERGPDVGEHTLERFTYADVGADAIAYNLCGQLMRHDDPAGAVHVSDLNMAGQVLKHTRRFSLQTDPPDWPMLAADRDALLETDDGAMTSYQFAATGEVLEQTDALENRQIFAYTVAGQLKDARLTLAGEDQLEKLLVSDIDYNVMDQIHSETAGNGVITRRRYDEANGRLTELSAHKANGTPLQDLKYQYDAVGNVLSIEDAAQPVRYFNNQRIEPTRTYRYDTLYQLIEASGCEAKTGQGGPALPDYQALPTDPGQIANYTQTYHYDASGNLLELIHLGAQAHGRTLTRERYSNRCLPARDNRASTREELANGFDANGNLLELQPGQPLSWDLRNQLSGIKLISRIDAQADSERYVYDGGGQRVRKVNVSQTRNRTITREVRYLPGLEIRTHGRPGEILHIITVNAESNNVQVLHWVAGRPDEVPQDQVRYSLNDHLGSSALQLDPIADLISQEWYYPFGGTAYWAGRNVIEAKYKTVCYSGKERDATGLYYYDFRYHAPWLQRWINPDPAGEIDGPNRYKMVRNNPVIYFDADGLAPKKDNKTRDQTSSVKQYFESVAGDEPTKKRLKFVKEKMSHTLNSNFEISSTYKTEGADDEDEFTNKFTKDRWKLKVNFRDKKTTAYFASDVIMTQYKIIAESHGFFGVLPKVIQLHNVKNEEAIISAGTLRNNSQALLDSFTKNSPLGSSLLRTLDHLGMKAVSVKIEIETRNNEDQFDYWITIAPSSKGPNANFNSGSARESSTPTSPSRSVLSAGLRPSTSIPTHSRTMILHPMAGRLPREVNRAVNLPLTGNRSRTPSPDY